MNSNLLNILGSDIYNSDLIDLFIRYLLNFVVAFIVIYFTYHRHSKKSVYTFTFFVFNTMVFMICYMLASVKLGIGVAFGLFAIFSVLRYRTSPIPIKEMTYLLIVISVAVINAISSETVSFLELGFINMIVLGVTYALESIWYKRQMKKMVIKYKAKENIHLNDHPAIMEDLKNTTGLDIRWFEIESMNISKGTASITVYYKENSHD